MNKNQQKVLLVTSTLIALITVKPPNIFVGSSGLIIKHGYSSIFSDSTYPIDTGLMLAQVFLALSIGSIMYILLNKNDSILSNLFNNIFSKNKSTRPINNKNNKGDYELFHGGDGLSKNSPVSINCASMEVAKSYMDIFIKDNCGDDCKRTDLEYTIKNPNDSEKLIKVIPVEKSDGTKMELFFDLSHQVKNFTNMMSMFESKLR